MWFDLLVPGKGGDFLRFLDVYGIFLGDVPGRPSKGCHMDGKRCHEANPYGLNTTQWRVLVV